METKLLDLNAYGVEEMSVAEMHEIEGGVLIGLFGVTRAIGNAAVWVWENCVIAFNASIGFPPSATICISCPIN